MTMEMLAHGQKLKTSQKASSHLPSLPLTLWLHGLLGVLLGEGEAERLRRLLTRSQRQPSCLAAEEAPPTPSSTLLLSFGAPSLRQADKRASVSESEGTGLSSSWGRTRQCREERQLPGPKSGPLSPPSPPPLSQLCSSEGADKKVVQNIILADQWRASDANKDAVGVWL